MDNIFDKLNAEPEGDFDPSNLPDLPPEQLKLARYIMRHSGITDSRLRETLAKLSPEDRFYVADIDAALSELEQKGILEVGGQGNAKTYRIRIQRKPRRRTMQGIWDALDTPTPQSEETAINPEIRKTRSALANSILDKLNQPPPANKQPTQHDPSLMNDLVSGGRLSVEKRRASALQDESRPREALDTVMRGISETQPTPTEPETPPAEGFLSRLLTLLGFKK